MRRGCLCLELGKSENSGRSRKIEKSGKHGTGEAGNSEVSCLSRLGEAWESALLGSKMKVSGQTEYC